MLSKLTRLQKWIVAIVLIALAVWYFGSNNRHKPSDRNTPVTVLVSSVIQKDMPLSMQFPGNIETVESVAVKSQVSGTLQAIGFKAGDTVEEKQLLFTIDPAPFLQKVVQAKQNLLKDQATLKNLNDNAARARGLVRQKYVSQQEYENLNAQAQAQDAVVKSDKALLKDAEINLSYTKIHAPIRGKTGNINLKVGDLVTQDGATPLVTINQLDSVYASFQVPQDKLIQIQQFTKDNPLTVEVFTDPAKPSVASGKLVFINNEVTSDSGTVQLKATIDNSKGQLWPAQFITVKLILAIEPNRIVIPSRAIRLDEEGAYVYMYVDGKAHLRRVIVERQIEQESIIQQGLKPGETIITTIPTQLLDNDPVVVGKP